MSSVEYLREFVSERLTVAAEEIFGVFKQTIVEYEEEIDRQRRLLDIVWKPEIKLLKIELPQHNVCTEEEEEEVRADQQLCVPERNSSVDQEDAEPPQIKEELCTSQEGEQLELKQETETFIWTPTDEDSDHSQDTTMNLSPDKTLIPAEKESDVNIPVHLVSEPNNDHWLLSDSSRVAESQYLIGGEPGSSGSTRDAEPEQNNQRNESRRHTNNGYSSTMSGIHYNTHTGEKSWKCHTCGKDFKYKSLLQRHLRIHTGERPYICKTCGKDFRFGNELKVHMRTHTSDKLYFCSTCKKTFSNISAYNGHMSIHIGEKPHTCTTCGKAFRQSSELTVHLRNTHNRERRYLCTTCGKRFINISALKRHVVIHTGERPYICKTCGKRFNDISALKRHMNIHTGEKPHVCKACGKKFSDVSTLKRHMTIHTGEKPFACNTCGKAFRRNGHLTDHIKRAHTAEKP